MQEIFVFKKMKDLCKYRNLEISEKKLFKCGANLENKVSANIEEGINHSAGTLSFLKN